jgi:hypothetical protein
LTRDRVVGVRATAGSDWRIGCPSPTSRLGAHGCRAGFVGGPV